MKTYYILFFLVLFLAGPPDLDRVSNHLSHLKHVMDIENLQGKQENQLRERHHYAVQNLRGIQQVTEVHLFINSFIYIYDIHVHI